MSFLLEELQADVRSPWPIFIANPGMCNEFLTLLRDNFPINVRQSGRTDTDKSYSFRTRPVTAADAPPVYDDLLRSASSRSFRSTLESLTGTRLMDADIALDAWTYQRGDFLSVHTDKPEKILTVIVYLDSATDEGGGDFCIHGTKDPRDIVVRIRPAAGRLVVFERSDHSWHSVEPVLQGVRRTLTVTYRRR